MKPSYVIIHHSLTKDSKTVSWGAIRRYHVEELGWRDIGYHYGIERVGFDYEIFLGRMPTETGAHCRSARMNSQSLGVCLIGNFDKEVVPTMLWNKTTRFVKSLIKIHGIKVENVLGHREAGALDGDDWRVGSFKSCPGSKFSMEDFRSAIT